MNIQAAQPSAEVGLFAAAWRISRERLRQQQEMLAGLFAAAEKANSERPILQPTPDGMTEAYWEEFNTFFEKTGIRDAYATAIVMVIDDILKTFHHFHKQIPGTSKIFTVGVNGVDVFTIFQAAGNNVRHYLDWRMPTHQIDQPLRAHKNVKTIAAVVGRPIPDLDSISGMALNWAWQILYATGSGTFVGLLAKIRECMDESIRAVGMENDALVVAEIAKECS